MDLSKAIPLSSGDVTNALMGFFSVGPVLAVLALVVALLLVPRIVRALVHASGSRAGNYDTGVAPVGGGMTYEEFSLSNSLDDGEVGEIDPGPYDDLPPDYSGDYPHSTL